MASISPGTATDNLPEKNIKPILNSSPSIGGFQSRDTFDTWGSTLNGNAVNGLSKIFIIDI